MNPKKTRKYDKNRMRQAIQNLMVEQNILNAECILFDGLTADIAKEYGATFLIRGVRNGRL